LKRAVTIQQTRLQDADTTNRQQASQAEALIADLQVSTLLARIEDPWYPGQLIVIRFLPACWKWVGGRKRGGRTR
jgi:hypothetical protein